MITLPFVVLGLSAASAVHAIPLQKRIAQSIAESTAQWEQACLTAGGNQQCNPISVSSMSTLLAAAGPCDQQNAADTMIDLAKQLDNDPEMIRLAQLFAQQPRNSPDSLSIPYCQSPPNNAELNGLFQCQFEGVDKAEFTTGAVGTPGTIPFGLNTPLNPPGSCPAHPDGPVPDGEQLNTIVQDPGVSGDSNSIDDSDTNDGTELESTTLSTATITSSATPTASGIPTNDGNDEGDDTFDNSGDASEDDFSVDPSFVVPTASVETPSVFPDPTPTGTINGSGGSGFVLQNGQDAQALNAEFKSLTADSPCEEGENACVGGAFAQCVGGKFATTQCAGGSVCAALPLVNSRGTSITCTTQQEAVDRIARTGATGGLTGSN